jgi:DNA-binding XRE family transcriptional regulator
MHPTNDCLRAPVPLGELIHMARVVRGMSQSELADRANITQSQLSRLERETTADPSFTVICRLADSLGVSLGSLTSTDSERLLTELAQTGGPAAVHTPSAVIGHAMLGGGPVRLNRLGGTGAGHLLIVGDANTGKSTAAEVEALRLAAQGVPVSVIHSSSGGYQTLRSVAHLRPRDETMSLAEFAYGEWELSTDVERLVRTAAEQQTRTQRLIVVDTPNSLRSADDLVSSIRHASATGAMFTVCLNAPVTEQDVADVRALAAVCRYALLLGTAGRGTARHLAALYELGEWNERWLTAASAGHALLVHDRDLRGQVRIEHSDPTLVPGRRRRPQFARDVENAPPSADRPEVISLGTLGDSEGNPIGMRGADTDANLAIVGASGTGKTEQIKHIAVDLAKAGHPLLVLDTRGILTNELAALLCEHVGHRADDIIIADLTSRAQHVSFNPLDVSSHEHIEPVVESVLEMMATQMQLGAQAPRAVNLASQAIGALCEANLHLKDPETKCTLLHIVTFFLDPEFRRLVLEFSTNPTIKENFDPERGPFEQMSEKQQAEMAMPIIRAIQPIGNSPTYARVFSTSENRLDIPQLLEGGRIVLVRLANYAHQLKIAGMAATLLTTQFYARATTSNRPGPRLIIDSAHEIVSANRLTDLIANGRRYARGLITSWQGVDDDALKLLDHTRSLIVASMDVKSAQLLAAHLDAHGRVTAGDIVDLPSYHRYMNVVVPEESGGTRLSGVFSAGTLKPLVADKRGTRAVRERIAARSQVFTVPDDPERHSHRVENIKGALGELWRQRALDSGFRIPDLDVDPDDESWSGS